MKKSLVLFILLFLISVKSWSAGLSSIEGPGSICLTSDVQKVTYSADYVMAYSAYTYELISKAVWTFTQDGVVVYTKSGDFVPTGMFGTTKVSVAGGIIPAGETKVTVTLTYTIMSMGMFTGWRTTSKSRNVYFGLATPSSITGPANLCPGATGTYTVATVSGATTYTWEVPTGWSVNGIAGPLVSNQGNSVAIKACTGCVAFSQNSIKAYALKLGVCISRPASINTTIDRPFALSSNDNGGEGSLYVTPASGTFSWSLPDYWQPTSPLNNYYVSFIHNGTPGWASVTVRTSCGTTYSRGIEFTPAPPSEDCGGGVVVYPNPADTYLRVAPDPCTELPMPYVSITDKEKFRDMMLEKNGNEYEVDVSGLEPGVHYLKVRTAKGEKTVRFIKSK